MEKEAYREIFSLPNIFTFSAILLLANFAFSRQTKQKIYERDKGRSVLSGETKNLHAAHINHDKKNPRYDHESNGRLLTVKEHLEVDHINRAGRNGLPESQNNWAIAMLQKLLSEGD